MKYELGRRIAGARRNHGMTQDELARLMNVSRQTVSHWEQGCATPGFESLCRLTQLLGFDVSDLLSGSRRTAEEER